MKPRPEDPYVISVRRYHRKVVASVFRPARTVIRRRLKLVDTMRRFTVTKAFAKSLDDTARSAIEYALQAIPAGADYEVIEE